MKSDPSLIFHHLAAALVPADAVGNCALLMHETVRDLGHESFLYAPIRGGGFAKSARPLAQLASRAGEGDVFVYHHSTGSDAADVFLGGGDVRRVLVYHNITPPMLLDRGGQSFAASARGLAQLPALVRAAEMSIVFSDFSAQDLRHAGGATSIKVIPMPLSDAWCNTLQATATKRNKREALAGEQIRLLHVGRVVPSKRLEIAVRAAEWLARDEGNSPVTLTLVGDRSADSDYVEQLMAYARDHPSVRLRLPGLLSPEALAEEFSTADVYLCPSAHEGFCVPLVECMFAELPVVAAASGAIPETLAESGIVLQDHAPEQFTEAASRLLDDGTLREKLRTIQRQVRARYTIQAFKQEWAEIIAVLPAQNNNARNSQSHE